MKRSLRWLFPAINSWLKTKLPTTDYFTTCTKNQTVTWVKSKERDCQPNLARRCSYTSKHGRFQTACHTIEGIALCWHPDPVPTQIAIDTEVLCLHCLLCYGPCVHNFGCAVAILCLPVAADFYIVVFQDVVTVAVALENACVCWQRPAFMVLAIPTKASARMCFYLCYFW